MTCVFTTSLEVQVDVFSEETLTGRRQLTSRAFLTFVAIDRDGATVQRAAVAGGDATTSAACAKKRKARRETRLLRKTMANG